MKINVLENEKNKLKIEMQGESTTIPNLVSKEIWQKDGEAASFKEHPFLSNPKLIVKGSNPQKILENSIESLENECDELKVALLRELKK